MIPQFEISLYPSQFFYTSIFFAFCYFVPVKILVNRISKILSNRDKFVNYNISIAEKNITRTKEIMSEIEQINKRNKFEREEIALKIQEEIDSYSSKLNEEFIAKSLKIKSDLEKSLILKINRTFIEESIEKICSEYIKKIKKSDKCSDSITSIIKEEINSVDYNKKFSNIIDTNLI